MLIGESGCIFYLSHTGDCFDKYTTFSAQVRVADKHGSARAQILFPILKWVSRAHLCFDWVLDELHSGFQGSGTGFPCS